MNYLNLPLALAFLFFMGATAGWLIEFLFRNLVSHKGPKGRYFINPGFCKGPWLPIYGIGLAAMCLISQLIILNIKPELVNSIAGTIIIILCLGLAMNCIEFIGGIILLKGLNMRLWDYSEKKGNFMGIVCPAFALVWTGIGAVYYLFVHKFALEELLWFSENLAYAFVVGLFFGVFIIDYWSARKDAKIVKAFAEEQDVIVLYEELKAQIQQKLMESNKKQQFFNQIIPKIEHTGENLEQAYNIVNSASVETVRKRRAEKKAEKEAKKEAKKASKNDN